MGGRLCIEIELLVSRSDQMDLDRLVVVDPRRLSQVLDRVATILFNIAADEHISLYHRVKCQRKWTARLVFLFLN